MLRQAGEALRSDVPLLKIAERTCSDVGKRPDRGSPLRESFRSDGKLLRAEARRRGGVPETFALNREALLTASRCVVCVNLDGGRSDDPSAVAMAGHVGAGAWRQNP